MSDLLPAGVVRRDCPGCHGTGANTAALESICQICIGSGRVTIEAATGALARLVRCFQCKLLNHVRDTARVDGVSVCATCRRVQAESKFLADLYAPLGRAT